MSANLTSISNNLNQFPNLSTLGFTFNRLTNLDLTGCSQLNSLHVDNNDLTSINLTSCFDLAIISLNDNDLTSIDITPFPLLQEISINNNPNFNNIIFDTLPECGFLRLTGAQLSSSLVDSILIALDNNGLSGPFFYTCTLDGGTNGVPGVDGLAAAASLQLKEWSVIYNT